MLDVHVHKSWMLWHLTSGSVFASFYSTCWKKAIEWVVWNVRARDTQENSQTSDPQQSFFEWN